MAIMAAKRASERVNAERLGRSEVVKTSVQVLPSGSDAFRIGRKSGILRFIKLKKKERNFFKA